MKRCWLLVGAVVMLHGAVGLAGAVTWSANGHDYELFVAQGIAWNDAAAALQPGWYLATIISQEENDWLVANLLSGGAGEYWLGGFQSPSTEPTATAGWQWVTGEAWNYTNWNSGEPNDNYGPGSEQFLASWSIYGWTWNDELALGNITGYVAERGAPVPEPTTILLLGSGLVGLAGYGTKRKK